MNVVVRVHGEHASICELGEPEKVVMRVPLTAPLLARMCGRKERRFRAEHVSMKDTSVPPKDYPPHTFELGDAID